MRLTTLPLLGVLLTGQALALDARPTVFDVIDQRHARGELDEATLHLWKVAAIRAPELLPADLRALRAQSAPAARLAMTRVLVEARQWATRDKPRGDEVARLLMPPADMPLILESSTYPIRVSYDSSTPQSYAQRVLAASERSWQVETEQYGFTPPTIEPGAEFYRVHIDSTGMGGGAYTAPYDYDQRSSWVSCYSYIVFDVRNPVDYIDSTMAHEFNHAMQATMDCAELATFMENTATYIMSAVYPESFWETVMYMPYFQQQPWRALDFMDEYRSDGYEYGGALLSLYLVGAYAPDDGPVMMRQIWEACRQRWSAQDNDPDYYDAIARVVASRGGPAQIQDILVDFSEARYFVGSNDDQAHIPGARRLWDAEPTVSRYHALSELPVVDAGPAAGQQPAPFGTNYVLLGDLGERPLRVTFDGDDATRWAARLVLLGGSDGSASHTLELDPQTGAGELLVAPGDHRSALLVVVNLGTTDYDPDRRRWTPADYRYGLAEIPAAPVVERAEPAELVRGVAGQELRLIGSGFVGGERFAVESLTAGVAIVEASVEAANWVRLVVDVADDAALGPVALRVVNDVDSEITIDGLVEVVEPAVELGGCDCRSTGAGADAGLPVLLGLGFALCWRRRACAR